MMKVNSISFAPNTPIVRKITGQTNKNVSFCSNQNEVIKLMPNGTKLLLKGIDPEKNTADYIGMLDENDNLIGDMRYDKRYNEIRAIEYKKPLGGFNFIQNALTVSFDENKEISNIYLISHSDNHVLHSSLNIKHGFDTGVYGVQNNKSKLLSNGDKKSLLNYFLYYTEKVLSEVQSVNLKGSENISKKYSDFIRRAL